jgi:hypothetical protein
MMQSQKIRHYNSYADTTATQVPDTELNTQRQVGLWIDHRKAIIITLTDTSESSQIRQVTSHLESDARPGGGWPAHSGQDYKANTEDHQDRRITGHLCRYYDEVITTIRHAESILIFGPGEAKGELKKRIESKGLKGCKITVETAGEMTIPQITARVRQHFLK